MSTTIWMASLSSLILPSGPCSHSISSSISTPFSTGKQGKCLVPPVVIEVRSSDCRGRAVGLMNEVRDNCPLTFGMVVQEETLGCTTLADLKALAWSDWERFGCLDFRWFDSFFTAPALHPATGHFLYRR